MLHQYRKYKITTVLRYNCPYTTTMHLTLSLPVMGVADCDDIVAMTLTVTTPVQGPTCNKSNHIIMTTKPHQTGCQWDYSCSA